MSAAVVEIGTNGGHIGLGYVGGGRGTLAQEIVKSHFASLLIDKSPFPSRADLGPALSRIHDVWQKRRGDRSNQRSRYCALGSDRPHYRTALCMT